MRNDVLRQAPRNKNGQQELKWKFVFQKPRIVNDLYALILIYFQAAHNLSKVIKN